MTSKAIITTNDSLKQNDFVAIIVHMDRIRHSRSLKSQIREHKLVFVVYLLLRISVVLILIAQIFNRDWENAFYCVLSLVLMMIPSFIETNWHIDIPDTLEIIVLMFIYAAEILGELSAYYINVPFWDTMLHTITGFLAAAVGFSLCDIFNRNENIKFSLSPFFLAFVAFCFSMTVAVCWEFLEFFADNMFGSDMQKDTIINTIRTVELDPTRTNTVVSITGITEVYFQDGTALGLGGYLDIGLIDTMEDLFVNFVGALVFSFIGYFYTKNRGEGRFARLFIPTVRYKEAAEAKKLREEKKAEKARLKEENREAKKK